jgi:hypothetical protein
MIHPDDSPGAERIESDEQEICKVDNFLTDRATLAYGIVHERWMQLNPTDVYNRHPSRYEKPTKAGLHANGKRNLPWGRSRVTTCGEPLSYGVPAGTFSCIRRRFDLGCPATDCNGKI